jgi:hypothetical protein
VPLPALGGVPWVPPPEPPAPPDPRRHKRRLQAAAAALAALAALCGGVRLWSAIRPSPYPDHWDERVQPIVDVVEKRRGLEFEHPVPVDFLSEHDFDDRVGGDLERLPGADRRSLEQFASTYRALGLIQGAPGDVLDSLYDLSVGGGILAYYDNEKEEIVLRGKQLDTGDEVTVAHELTHALQDQHFDLGRLQEDAESDLQSTALLALIEGDAVRTQFEYVDTLAADVQAAYVSGNQAEFAEYESGLPADVPEILRVGTSMPYDLGPAFVGAVAASGEGLVDEAFVVPPVTDEHVLDPEAFLAGDEPEPVYAPALADDERKRGRRQPLGALGWYYVLASRIDTAVALQAVEGWGGDDMVGFERDGETCVRLAFTGDTPDDTAEMAEALDQWAARMPLGATSVDRGVDQVDVTACAPGSAAPAPNSVLQAHEILVARAILYTSFVTDGTTEEDARSASNALALDPAVRSTVLMPGEPTNAQLADLQEQVAAALEAGS